MKICFLADAPDTHTQKWTAYFAQQGCEVHLISFRKAEIPGVRIHPVKRIFPVQISRSASSWFKIGYLFYLSIVKRKIKKISPDILHAHWATSYGLFGAFSKFHPFIVSTWGGDVFDFPHRSIFHKWILKYVLNKADYITATSRMLTQETEKYLRKDFTVHTIPFGVDINCFKKTENSSTCITIGVVKNLEKKYGIEYLIRAFALLGNETKKIKLLIVGSGSQEDTLKRLCDDFQIRKDVVFTGYIPNRDVPGYLNKMDIFVMPSIFDSETFGVSVVEASACEIPVVGSNVGGLSEVICDGMTGFLVPPKDVEAIADKLKYLIDDESLRKRMGVNGRKFVLRNYIWEQNAMQMEMLYENILKKPGTK